MRVEIGVQELEFQDGCIFKSGEGWGKEDHPWQKLKLNVEVKLRSCSLVNEFRPYLRNNSQLRILR